MNDRPPHLPPLQAAVNGGAKRVVIPSTGVACNECEVLMLVGLPGETTALLLKRNTPRVCALRTFKAVQSLSPCCTLRLNWKVEGCNVQPTCNLHLHLYAFVDCLRSVPPHQPPLLL